MLGKLEKITGSLHSLGYILSYIPLSIKEMEWQSRAFL